MKESDETTIRQIDDLVVRFSSGLRNKLIASEKKHKWQGQWLLPENKNDLIKAFHAHVAKGDPVDIACYAAMAWHHGWYMNEDV